MSARMDERCQVCDASMSHMYTARMLSKYDVRYFRCDRCEFLRTEKPYWLQEAYSRAIAATDTGIVVRNLKIARQLTCVLPLFFGPECRFLDTAGGTGLLTRLMRDHGFDFYSEDPYCDNVLAFGFGSSDATGEFAAVTAFEALEHMEQPIEFIESCVGRSSTGTFIFSTELFASPVPNKDWWYFSLATGQHIAFFSMRTLEHVGRRLKLNLLSSRGLHLLSREKLDQRKFKRALRAEPKKRYESIANRKRSRTDADHYLMTARAAPQAAGRSNPSAAGTSQAVARFSFDGTAEVFARHAALENDSGWLRKRLRRWATRKEPG